MQPPCVRSCGRGVTPGFRGEAQTLSTYREPDAGGGNSGWEGPVLCRTVCVTMSWGVFFLPP